MVQSRLEDDHARGVGRRQHQGPNRWLQVDALKQAGGTQVCNEPISGTRARTRENAMDHVIPYPGAPVAVIGNGPVGETTSLLLARWGIPVIVLDGRPERDMIGSRAICQQRDVLDVWEACGVGRQLAGEGVTWSTARTYYKDRELFSIKLADAGHSQFPPFVNISQSRTEEVLAEKMAATPLIEQRWGHKVSTISQDGRA